MIWLSSIEQFKCHQCSSSMEVDFFCVRFEVKSILYLCKITFEKVFFVHPDFDQFRKQMEQ
jgi:hypothetical protein